MPFHRRFSQPVCCGRLVPIYEVYELTPTVAELRERILTQKVFIGRCCFCKGIKLAIEGLDYRDQVVSEFRYIKGRKQKPYLERIEQQHGKSQEAVFVVYGSEPEHGRLVKRIVS